MLRSLLALDLLSLATLLLSCGVQAEEHCALTGFDLGTLNKAEYWTARVDDTKNCIVPLNYNQTDVVSCDLYVSICKPLGDKICNGFANSSTCMEVITTDGNSTFYDMGVYRSNEDVFNLLNPDHGNVGFATGRQSGELIFSDNCDNETIFTYINFVCSDASEWDPDDENITVYLESSKWFFEIPCGYVIEFSYSGACYVTPTLSPGHCSLDNYDTNTLKSREYWSARVDDSACYNSSSSICIMYLSFCHPIPPEIGETCYGSSICQIGTDSAGNDNELNMGTYGNYTRFHENDETGENSGFYMVVENGSKPDSCKNGLKTQVILTCDEDKEWDNQDISDYVQVAYHHDSEPCMYVLTIAYNGACIAEANIISNLKQSPVGWIIMAILATGVIVYLAGGMAFNRFLRGESGIRIFPNYYFWQTGLIFVLEGCRFFVDVITCFKFEGRVAKAHTRQPDYDKI